MNICKFHEKFETIFCRIFPYQMFGMRWKVWKAIKSHPRRNKLKLVRKFLDIVVFFFSFKMDKFLRNHVI